MRVQITWKGMRFESDTISIFDDDNREIAIHRDQIGVLIKLLKAIKEREYGKLGFEIFHPLKNESKRRGGDDRS